MNKWTIFVECTADNMQEFDNKFFGDSDFRIPMNNVVGVMKVTDDEEEE